MHSVAGGAVWGGGWGGGEGCFPQCLDCWQYSYASCYISDQCPRVT